MGRIKSMLIKRTSRSMIQSDLPFTEQFDDNKKILGARMPSKKTRNKIAGYIARLKRMHRVNLEREAKKPKISMAELEQQQQAY